MDFKITKREVIASISIVAILFVIGLLISSKISESHVDKMEMYNKAVKIDSSDMFKYGMRTNVGNAFVHGVLEAIDPVTYSEIGGKYMYVEKVKEKYTKHTRTVTKTRTINGKRQTYTETETYYSWDKVDSDKKKSSKVLFCDAEFSINKFDIPVTQHIDTIKESRTIRYKYYGVKDKCTGTVFTELRNNTISNNSTFYDGKNISETMESLEQSSGIWVFWVLWIILTALCVYGFYYLDNKWLE